MKYLLSLCCIFLCSANLQAADCPPVSKKMTAEITRQLEQLRATETCENRYIYKEMGVELVLFSIKGSCINNPDATPGTCSDKTAVYLAGVISGQVLAAVETSDAAGFAPIKVRKETDVAVVTGLKHAPTDPLCCPSIKEARSLKITATGFQP